MPAPRWGIPPAPQDRVIRRLSASIGVGPIVSAEFLSIKALRKISGDAAANRYIARLQSAIDTQDKPLPAFDAIDGNSDLGKMCRYVYGLLLLLSLEKLVGEAKMQAFMRGMLVSPSPKSWAELQTIAVKAGIDAKTWEHWRASCVAGGRQRCQ